MTRFLSLSILLFSLFCLFGSCGTLNKGQILENKEIYIKPVEKNAHWYERVEKFISEKDSIEENSLIFLGNSIIEGYDLKKFFPNHKTVNRGIASDHIDGVLDRLDISLGDAETAKLVVLIGINDIGAGRSEAAVKYLYKKLIDAILKKKHYEVYLHSILPTSPQWKNCDPGMIVNMNAYIKSLAGENGLDFVDIYPLFRKENSNYVIDEYMRDGLHPNDAGYKIWTEHLTGYLGR